MTAFDIDALRRFSTIYPNVAGKLAHNLAGHPLLTLDALAGLAERLPRETVEYNRGDLPVGIDPELVQGNGLGPAETVRGIETNGSWMVLKFVEQDPRYRELLDSTLAALMPLVGPTTGTMHGRQGFVFISSPGSVTPFHFDPEHNILMQLRGTKTMTVLPAHDDAIVAQEEHERFHLGGHRNLPWRKEFAALGEAFDLTPGEAIHVPVKAPHWVKNGPAVSISFSITWRSRWSHQEADARGMNSVLRRWGLQPASPKPYPDHNMGKSVVYRALRKVRG